MSSISRHKRSKFWSARFRLANGRRVTRSTKLTDRKLAQSLADQWEQAGKGELSACQIQRVTSEIYKEVTSVDLPSHSIRAYLTRWLDRKVPEVSASSADKYRYTVGEFLRHLGPRADSPLRQISETDLRSFRDACQQKTRSKTTNNKLVMLAAAFREAWMDGYIADDIGKRLKKIKCYRGDAQQRAPFTQAQVDAIIAKAEGEWKGIAILGAYTGQRLGDIVNLRWGDLLGYDVAFVSRKTDRLMNIPLNHPVVSEWVSQNKGSHDASAYLFPESHATCVKNRHKVAALSKQFHALLASLGLVAKRQRNGHGNGRGAKRTYSPLSFHSFRHYLTTEFHRCGVPGAVVRDIIGHDSEYVNRLYTHIDADTKRRAMAQLTMAQRGLATEVVGQ